MKRLLTFFWLFVLTNVVAQGQILWKVSNHDSSRVSYLFGTHHLIAQEKIPGMDTILHVFDHSKLLVGEVDLLQPEMVSKTTESVQMTEITLKKLVSGRDYTMLDRSFKTIAGIGISQLDHLYPMALLSLHQVMSYLKAEGLTTQPQSLDVVFQERAKWSGKQVVPLESLDDQLELLYKTLPLKRQADLLVQSVKLLSQSSNDVRKLNECYLTGDLETMQQMWLSDDGLTPVEKSLFTDDRNRKWMEKLIPLFNQTSCFVAVGCMHLTGTSGLLNQLKQAGFQLTPVSL